jgi:2,3-bisphosphoglycerate-dependent phosphoglycerate mutase
MSNLRVYEQTAYRLDDQTTEVLLLRHGQSEAADPGRPFELVEGRSDPSLSALGRRQAVAVSARLLAHPLSAIFVTPLRRTSETVNPLTDALGMTPVIERGLIEVHLGEWEGGLYRQRVAERHPVALEVDTVRRWDVIPGAESNESIQERSVAAIERIAAAHRGTTVLVATHGGTIAAVLAHAVGAPVFSFLPVDNASISAVVVGGGHWVLRRFNDASHLESLEPTTA